MKDHFIYPAVFDFADDGISVEFPDIPGCLTCGDTIEEALHNAHEALELNIWSMEDDNEDYPTPSLPQKINIDKNQTLMMIDVWMVPVRDEMANKAVKKTLTIPRWLDEVAKEEKVNFSAILQGALKEYLGIVDKKRIKYE